LEIGVLNGIVASLVEEDNPACMFQTLFSVVSWPPFDFLISKDGFNIFG
jgi:hypothetical protein